MDYDYMAFDGTLGRDPEMRFTPSGQAVTSFSAATNREYLSANGEKVKVTIWRRIQVWGKQAEACNQYLKKGSKVLVIGRLDPDKATGSPKVFEKQDKTFGAAYDVTAVQVIFRDRKPADNGAQEKSADIVPEDDIPF